MPALFIWAQQCVDKASSTVTPMSLDIFIIAHSLHGDVPTWELRAWGRSLPLCLLDLWLLQLIEMADSDCQSGLSPTMNPHPNVFLTG